MTTYNMALFTKERMDKLDAFIPDILNADSDRSLIFAYRDDIFSEDFIHAVHNYKPREVDRERQIINFLDICREEIELIIHKDLDRAGYNGSFTKSNVIRNLINIVDAFCDPTVVTTMTINDIKIAQKSLKRIHTFIDKTWHEYRVADFVLETCNKFGIDKSEMAYLMEGKALLEGLTESLLKRVKSIRHYNINSGAIIREWEQSDDNGDRQLVLGSLFAEYTLKLLKLLQDMMFMANAVYVEIKAAVHDSIHVKSSKYGIAFSMVSFNNKITDLVEDNNISHDIYLVRKDIFHDSTIEDHNEEVRRFREKVLELTEGKGIRLKDLPEETN